MKKANYVIKITEEQKEILRLLKFERVDNFGYWRDFRTLSFSYSIELLIRMIDPQKLTSEDLKNKIKKLVGKNGRNN